MLCFLLTVAVYVIPLLDVTSGLARDSLGDPLPKKCIGRLGTDRLRQDSSISCVKFSPTGRVLASGGQRYASPHYSLYLWDAATGKEIRQFIGHKGDITHLAFSPDGKAIASTSEDCTLRLWSVASGKEQWVFRDLQKHLLCVSWASEKLLAAGGIDGRLRLFDPATAKLVQTLVPDSDGIYSMAASPSTKVLAVAGLKVGDGDHVEGIIACFDLANYKLQRALKGHNAWVNALAFSPS